MGEYGTPEERVARGIDALDKYYNGWWRYFNEQEIEDLNLNNPEVCLLGVLGRNRYDCRYGAILDDLCLHLDLDLDRWMDDFETSHGFIDDGGVSVLWKAEIRKRQAQ